MSKTTKTNTDPWKPAQPFILQGLQQSGEVQQAQQPKLNAYSSAQMGTYGRLAPGAEAGIMGSQGLVNDTIGGKYLNNNPYMDGMMKTTNDNITNGVNSQFEQGGRYGSANHAGILAQRIGEADNQLQYQNYSDERNRQTQAIGQSEDLMRGSQATLNNAADLPWIGVSALNGNVRQASNGYGSTSQTTSDPMGQITGLIGAGASAFSAYHGASAVKSDERIKNVGRQVGTTPDGLPIYDYTYKGDPAQTPQTGVMAQDVEKLRPDAVGPTDAQGVKSVDYGKLDLPDPSTMAQQAHPGAGLTDATGAPVAPVAPQDLGKIYPNSDNVDRSFGGILGRFANPDPNDKWGKIGLLGQQLMAGDGSPFQSLGKGLIGSQKAAADAATAKQEGLFKQAQIMAQLRTANKPTITSAGGGIFSTNADGTATTKLMDVPKEAPFGQSYDPATNTVSYANGIESPAQKEANAASVAATAAGVADTRSERSADRADARSLQSSRDSDARLTRTLTAKTDAAKSGMLDPASVTDMAAQYLAGDKSSIAGLGRGTQGAGNIALVRREIHQQMLDGNMSGKDVAAKMAEFTGLNAAQRTAGVKGAQTTLAGSEFDKMVPLALQASAAVPRSGFLPFGKAGIMFNEQTNDPATRNFAAANNAVVNTYVRTVSPTGVGDAASREHARQLLSTAYDQPSYLSTVRQLQKEASAAIQAPKDARMAITNGFTGRGGATANPFNGGAQVPANIAAILAKHGAH